jgi:RHS repeat-associated protein
LISDHLGSTSIAANADGTLSSEQRYKPWGEKRYPTGASTLPTTFRFTGQRQEPGLGGAEGLYYYGARWYDPALGRFAQADSIIPEATQGAQAWDRYAGMNNNPVKYTDPTGHWPSWSDIVNGVTQVADFVSGATYQFVDDMTQGGLTTVANSFNLCTDCNMSEAMAQGRQAGRVVSTVVSATEAAVGSYVAAVGLASLPPTAGAGAACTVTTGGACAVVVAPALAVEEMMVVGGGLATLHGGTTLAYIEDHPAGGGVSAGTPPLKGQEAADAAAEMGYTQRIPAQKAPFDSHGQTVFYNPKTKTYITVDVDQHHGPAWKMFNRDYERLGTYDLKLEQKLGK